MKKKDSTPGGFSPSSTVVAPATIPASSHHYLAKIIWMDTVGSSSWDRPDEIDTMEVQQWGWVVFHDGHQLKVADTKMEGDWYGVTAIPAGCIVAIERIGD
jgi:hypothetical protein